MKENFDPNGNPRTIPVKFKDGPHKGLVVFHSKEEYERLWAGVDKEAVTAMADWKWDFKQEC